MQKSNFKTFLTEEEQFLAELHGYHKYEDKDFYEIINDIARKNGHDWDSGALGVVFMPKDKNFVYKCWIQDGGYEKYLEIVEKHQDNVFFPKLLSKKRKLETFFKRPTNFEYDINIVKMEKLNPLPMRTGLTNDLMRLIKQVEYCRADKLTLDWVKKEVKHRLRFANNEAKKLLNTQIDKNAKRKVSKAVFNDNYLKAMKQLRTIILEQRKLEKYLEPAYEAMQLLIRAKIDNDLQCDMHSGNFMVRDNGDLVITDPFVVENFEQTQTVMKKLKTNIPSMPDTTTGRRKKGSTGEKKTEEKEDEPESQQQKIDKNLKLVLDLVKDQKQKKIINWNFNYEISKVAKSGDSASIKKKHLLQIQKDFENIVYKQLEKEKH